jgi:phage-related tail protein
MTDSRTGSNPPGDDWTSGNGDASDASRSTAREWLSQLQAMIDNVATHATPVVREVAAKAAELAAVAGEKAGPIAHKAAEVTAQAGTKVAERGREVAAELRRDAAQDAGDTGETGGAGSEPIAEIEAMEPGGDTPTTSGKGGSAPLSDTPDALGE